MSTVRKRFKLKEEEKLFIELSANSDKDDLEIVKELWPTHTNPPKKLRDLARNNLVQEGIQRVKDINRYKVNYSEEELVHKLLREADDPNNRGSERIQAIVWLGKHIGMFSDKKDEQKEASITYNIVNYSGTEGRVEKLIDESKISDEDITDAVIEVESYKS